MNKFITIMSHFTDCTIFSTRSQPARLLVQRLDTPLALTTASQSIYPPGYVRCRCRPTLNLHPKLNKCIYDITSSPIRTTTANSFMLRMGFALQI